ncbi:T9SS type A sorting domain-containing protein, partial [bacterium]|nr:T9SS type A sorting domain-containing protein [bacterium]
ESWEVSGTASSSARLRVISDNTPTLGDTSAANFTIISPCIEITSPAGNEIWTIGDNQTIAWTSGGVAGNVEIAINRNYPTGDWEVLFANAANDEEENWIVTGPSSSHCRMRVKSINDPNVFSISAEDFWISSPNEAPQIFHDPLHDIWELPALITAVISDEPLPQPPVIQLYYRLENAPHYNHTVLQSTVYPNEYAALLETINEGRYDYYIRAVDALGAADSTNTFSFDVGSSCSEEMAYDDGEGESFDWMQDTRFRWAVKFSPETFPFALCAAQFAVAYSQPNMNHESVFIEIFQDDGGLPGELLYSDITGSVGNVIGGLPEGVPLWADVVLRESNIPLIFENDFFIAVSNPDSSGYEAFARDTTGNNSNRSFFYNPGDAQWYNENTLHTGNRMIRASGFTFLPPDAFALLSPASAETVWTLTPTLDWEDASSPNPYDAIYYVLYWSQNSDFVDADSVVTDSSFYSFTGNELPDDVTIYWKVRAVNCAGLSRWAEPESGWNFTVFYPEPPSSFHLLSPADSTMFWQPNVELQWGTATDPDPGDSVAFYRVFLAEDINFNEVDSFDVSETTLSLTNLMWWEYWWKVRAYDTGGLWRESDEIWYFWISLGTNPGEPNGMPKEFALEQNYPNPFNPSTTIQIALPERSHAAIEIFDILGRRVAVLANHEFQPGYHLLQWKCESCAAGIYFVQMRAGDFVQTRKMLLVR